MTDLTEESLKASIIEIQKYMEETGRLIAFKPTTIQVAADPTGFYGLPSGLASASNVGGNDVTDGETSPNMNFTWSFSSYKQYLNCPKQYHEVKVLKRFHVKPTAQMTYGNEVHKACEDYVAEGKPLAKNYQRFKPVLDTIMEIKGTRYPEQKMALDVKGGACQYGKDYWVRGIVDLMIIDGDTAFIIDYKTGSNRYPEPKQLKLMALMAFAHHPKINYIKAGLLFIVHNSFMTEEYSREDIPQLWDAFHPDLNRIDTSYIKDVWSANPTQLCGWCPVNTCSHHKER